MVSHYNPTTILDSVGGYSLKINSDGSLNIAGSITASNPSVSATGAAVPVQATAIGWQDGSGNLQIPSAANPLPVSASVSISESVTNVQGNATSAATLSNFPVNPTTGYRSVAVQVTNAGNTCTLVAEESNDGTTWTGCQTIADTTVQTSTPMTAVGKYIFNLTALQFRIRCSVYGSGTPAVNAEFRQTAAIPLTVSYLQQINTTLGSPFQAGGSIGNTAFIANAGTNLNTSALNLEATQSAFKTANHTDLAAINTTLGSPFQAGGSIANTAFGITGAIPAGTNLIGKVGIDQTTPGTTNAVSATNFPAAVSTGTGAQGASSPRVTVATDSATVAGSASLPAGTNLVGKVGIDQTTPGTTNAVSATNFPAAVSTGTGAQGASSPRVTVATDTATIAGSAPGTAGSASAQVVTVQGVASMTPLLVTPAANSAVNIAQIGGTNAVSSGVAGALAVGGPTASGSSVAANPTTIGGRGATANPSAVADGQAVNTMHDKLGKLIAVGAIRTLKGTQNTIITASTAETTIVTQVASTFLDLYGLILANTGATTTKVDIRDTTGGSIIATIEVPTLETRGFMVPVDSAIPQTTVNTNWTAQCGSSTSSLQVTAFWVKNT